MKSGLIAFAALLLSTAALEGQDLMTTAPIENFKFPVFNDEGYRIWRLTGDEGLYIQGGEIKISKLTAEQYLGRGSDETPISILVTPQATLNTEDEVATGPGDIDIQSDKFQLTGEDWIWQGKQNVIIINKNVKVVLFDQIGDILK